MRVRVRAFASYREALGTNRVEVDVPDGATPLQVWEALAFHYPKLRDLPPPSGYAVQDSYVSPEIQLSPEDELVLIPPVSGGAHIQLTAEPISVDEVLRSVAHPQAGAIVLFLGTVRDNSSGRHVHHLEYEAYQELALREMARIAAEAEERWDLRGITMVHRTGYLEVGEVSVAIAVSAPHRKDAFEAGKFLIDTLKQRVPIWKKEVWEGGEAWVVQ
ncbi:MAG: molybdenum cofactor biosynthesis protein MoaE [Armatimonadota bacterium]|nr:molybdenum cofactor biosynthesis protein MoaE [Armatimonadota bacterium]